MTKKNGRWTREEQEIFEEAYRRHGKEWKLIADMLESRTIIQVRTHAQKYFQKLAKKTGQPVMSTSKKPQFNSEITIIHGEETNIKNNFSSPVIQTQKLKRKAGNSVDSTRSHFSGEHPAKFLKAKERKISVIGSVSSVEEEKEIEDLLKQKQGIDQETLAAAFLLTGNKSKLTWAGSVLFQ